MSFNIALSGVAAAQRDLDVTANNIANVNTPGYSRQRVQFTAREAEAAPQAAIGADVLEKALLATNT